MKLPKLAALTLSLMLPSLVFAQGMQIGFGSLQQDSDQPVEITADSLSLNQTDGTALFQGNVLIIQGTMRMTAPEVLVFYNEDTSGISRLETDGGRVLIVKDGDAAEADVANYNIEDGIVVMTGDVLLTQGNNTLNSNRMTADLNNGTAQMEGRVKTILKTEDE
ncbi:lipopolysaccharide transport periplasmic protein LptA [uncultured Shimia sp.]|uniref:lipopolysaccharide transport periplasmic protein LptA n=1 Tax=uncultured Shimia sp. TaxID=573152 RepID=UPI002616DE9A|nr:lipopolysaccharide transport periplasmic protein LptA [uncultured Shimia sp.]